MSQISTINAMSQLSQLESIMNDSQLTPLVPVNVVTSEESGSSTSRPPARGWVNEHFKKVVIGHEAIRVCLAEGCNKQYKAGSSHFVFKAHWRREHSTTFELKRTRFLFTNQLHTHRLVRAVIDLHWDFAVVDKISFRKFIEAVNPNKPVICRQTVANLINQGRSELACRIREILDNVESIALTFDIWSVRKGARGFGCVTAHYISALGKIENIILHFERMSFPHDALTISKFIKKPVEAFKLEGKVAAITTDNASNNIAAIRLIDSSLGLTSLDLGFIHYKCVAHILDLGMKAAMKDLRDTLRPVRDAVMAIRSSRKRKEMFIDKQKEYIQRGDQLTKQPMELAEDVDHRWNSLFVLLERAYLLRKSVDFMLASSRGMETMEPIDWSLIEAIIAFLKPFNEATKRLCEGSIATISIVSIIIPRLIEHCSSHQRSDNQWICEAANSMQTKLTSYELELYHPVVDVACFLDPRFKTKNLSEEHSRLVMDRMKHLLDLMPAPMNDSTASSEVSILGCDSDNEEQKEELILYRDSRREKLKTDVIAWWNDHTEVYPKLSALARKVFPIQATSVASERVFSVAGDVDTKSRNRLSDESVENIVLFKSWMQFLNIE